MGGKVLRRYVRDMPDCGICRYHTAAENGDDPWTVARLVTGYVRLSPNQYFRGTTFFSTKQCVDELHQLERPTSDAHLVEMADVSAATFAAFAPKKLNTEVVGNVITHWRWWLIPRHADDARPADVIWLDMAFWKAQWTNSHVPDEAERTPMLRRLLEQLEATGVTIEKSFL